MKEVFKLNETEARDYLRIGRTTLWNYRTKCGLPSYKPKGKDRFYLKQELQSWLKSQPNI